MKFSFSTLACPDYTWADIYSMAKDLGFDGIEVRGLGNDIFDASKNMPFSPRLLPATKQKLRALRLTIPCLSSGCCLRDGATVETVAEVRAYIEAAESIGTPYVRVLGDLNPAPDGDVDDEAVLAALRALLPYAEEKGVTLLVETNGVYSDTARLRALLDRAPSDNVGALWDVHHPYRFAGESPEKTVQNLGMYIKHVHIKDSAVTADGSVEYRLMGEGDLPVDDIMRSLRSVNYEGFLSLEWVKRWLPELSDAGVVIPQFIHYMSRYTIRPQSAGRLQDNHAGTGKYVWPKETLIDLTFPQVLDRMVEEFPDQYCFRYTTCDYTRTYREFRDDVDTFARALISLGVKRGDHVAIWATNVPQWYITFWATVKIGAVLVTVNTAYKIYEAEYLLRQSDTHTLVMTDGYKDSNYVEIIKELCPELAETESGKPLYAKRLPFLRNVITVDSEQPGCLTWAAAMDRAGETPVEEVYRRAASISKHDVCNMQYTSGTTGFPKGVMLTHYNVVNNGKNIGDCMDLSTADRLMIQVPMFHCFGMVLSMTSCMTHGATLCPMPYFSAKVSLACINQERITCFNGVPTMFIAMFNHPDYKKTDFSYMRTGIMAGSGCPPELMRRAAQPDEMHMSDIVSVYGQTESAPGSTMSACGDPLDLRCNTVGYAFPHIECKIIDPETGEEVPDGVNGEFCSRGYNTMKGYYKMPEATAATVDKEGWLHSGDLACRDENGCYRITGRLKDMIIRGGENIYPKEIEEFIYTHPAVKDVQVIGVPDKKYGEEAMACIILKEPGSVTVEEMLDYIKASMARHKVPKYIDFVDAFPMNAAGKILKYKMREEATERFGLEGAAGIDTAQTAEQVKR